MPGRDGGQSLAVEPGDQVGDRVPALAADRPGGVLVRMAVADQQDQGSPGDLGGRCGARPVEAGEFALLGGGEPAEWVLLGSGHTGSSRVTTAIVPAREWLRPSQMTH